MVNQYSGQSEKEVENPPQRKAAIYVRMSTEHQQYSIENQTAAMDIRSACKKILLSQESLRIIINSQALAGVLKEQLNLTLPQIHADITYEMAIPYCITRSSKGAFRIDGVNESLSKDDPFNRAEHEVQNWVRGIVWRDLYFRGKSLDDIAGQEAIDVRYVSRLIDESLSII